MPAMMVAWLSLPPNAPPMRRTSTVTALKGSPSRCATPCWTSVGCWVELHTCHLAGLAGDRERDLSFEIEMVLPAAAQFAGQSMRRRLERRLDLAAQDVLRGRDEAPARHRLLDGEHGGQRLVFDVHQLCRRARRIERLRRDRRHRLAFVLHHIGGQGRLVAVDRSDVVLARNVGSGDRRHHSRSSERAGEINPLEARA